jgi:hypothetical protein
MRSPNWNTSISVYSTGSPSGWKANIGEVTLTCAPLKTIKFPSGDYTGFNVAPSAMRSGAPPPTGILKSP